MAMVGGMSCSPDFGLSLSAPGFRQSGNMEPVSFSVVRAGENSRNASDKLLLERTITDIGYGLDKKNSSYDKINYNTNNNQTLNVLSNLKKIGWYADRSEFICYYPGTYFFTFSALSTPSSAFRFFLS